MNENEYFVTHSAGICICDSISRRLPDDTFEEVRYQDIADMLNEKELLKKENVKLKSDEKILFDYFYQWFEEERGIFYYDFKEWWEQIKENHKVIE